MSAQRGLTSFSGGFESLGISQVAHGSGLQPSDLRRTMSTAATAAYDQSVDVFPSLIIGANGSIEPQGSFAEAQAQVSWQEISFLFISVASLASVGPIRSSSHSLPNNSSMHTFFDLLFCSLFLVS